VPLTINIQSTILLIVNALDLTLLQSITTNFMA